MLNAALMSVWLISLECPHSVSLMAMTKHHEVAQAFALDQFDLLTEKQKAECEINIKEQR